MKPEPRRDSAQTRAAILDATEQVMREDGYAAVSSRRIAEAAGLKSKLVHYYFGSMDDLFLALYQRVEERHFARHVQALSSPNPLRAAWELLLETTDTELIAEFRALANHRKAILKEIARSAERMRTVQAALLSRGLEAMGVSEEVCPPVVLSVLMAGAARALVSENAIGVSAGHPETLAFIERHLRELEARGRPPVSKAS